VITFRPAAGGWRRSARHTGAVGPVSSSGPTKAFLQLALKRAEETGRTQPSVQLVAWLAAPSTSARGFAGLGGRDRRSFVRKCS
jgi:hypothetical protein